MMELNTLQNEFENLIDQLGSLKSINDLTNRNSDATETLLKGIETFVNELQGFQDKITGSYSRLSDSVDDQTEHLQTAVSGLEKKTEEINSFISDEFTKLYTQYEQQVLARVGEMSDDITSRTNEMSSKVMDHTGAMSEEVIAKASEISEEVKNRNDELSERVAMKTEYMSDKLTHYSEMIEQLEVRIAQLEKGLRSRQDTLEDKIVQDLADLEAGMEERHQLAEATKAEMMAHKKMTNIMLMVITALVVLGFSGIIFFS